jgi:hypothetical protein
MDRRLEYVVITIRKVKKIILIWKMFQDFPFSIPVIIIIIIIIIIMDSVVGIATGYELDDRGVQSR